jgi:Rod binding domain-containing protein
MPGSLPSNTQDDLSSAQGSAAIKTLRGAQAPGADPRKIEKAARSFESLLVGHWLEQAEKSFVAVPGVDQDEQNDSSRSQFMSIACESLAQGLSKAGGFGIANMITKRLEAATKTDSQQESHPASMAASFATSGHKLSGGK